jgi:hypothetical protein
VAQACWSAMPRRSPCPSTTRQPYRAAIRSTRSPRFGARYSATGLANCTRQPCSPRKARPHPATTPITTFDWSEYPKCSTGRYPAKSHGSARAYSPHRQSRCGAASPGCRARRPLRVQRVASQLAWETRAPRHSRCTTVGSASATAVMQPPGRRGSKASGRVLPKLAVPIAIGRKCIGGGRGRCARCVPATLTGDRGRQ